MNSNWPVEREEKERSLALVEASETFSGQDQLKSFLHFVCECEMSGQGANLHEYLIGTEVFGQKEGYSTTENSIVRRQAYSLRHKLLDFYATEGADAVLRIEIPKGSYCPRFVRVGARDSVPPPAQKQPSTEVAPAQGSSGRFLPRYRGYILGAACVVACLICGFVGYRLASHLKAQGVPPVIQEAWGPILGPDANPIICVATNAQLLILSLPAGSTDAPEVPNEMHLDAWYSQHFRHPPGERLYYYPNYSTPLWGDASGAVSISRVFTRAGVDAQILPEHVLDTFVLRDRNVFLLGRPQDSAAAALFLNGLFYNIKWFSDVKDLEIYFTEPQMNVPRRLEHKTDSVHGLITVISSTNHEGSPTRMVILSGINTAGTLGAAEFFSSPDQMQEFKTRLIHDGYKAFPKVYQIVISTESNQTLPFKSSMESYKVITQ